MSEARNLNYHNAQKFLTHVQNPLVRLFATTILFTGMRPFECAGLRYNDVDLVNGVIHVRGKKGKYRAIPIHRELHLMLEDYAASRSEETVKGNGWFFERADGGSPRPYYYTRVIRQTAKKLGWDAPTSPAQLRHAFATELFKQGVSLRTTADVLGHCHREVFVRLSPINAGDLRQAIEKLPLFMLRLFDVIVGGFSLIRCRGL
ncbi:site-specific integrase [Alicyclobacillus cycloheptanicus]|uniref:Integrase n=1 Tax=Alicyclobacillus cycloheptanicus TaxID=1457 RepID=A0ABT9XMH6_9BACL|nr:site-specific integrase [Alicyclobacillus cycloheptanicus]MDQ0191528.1 integrase [Alicyclobacillus cycloheptanicus]WDM02229.1 site-specific integrase [Alicyclobacillus cycloheptanicus]